MTNDVEIPKYKKKSQKKSPKKADHKHEWRNCVYQITTVSYSKNKGFYKDTELTIGSYCPICGKIGNTIDTDYLINTSPDNRFSRTDWSFRAKKEFDSNTRTLPFFEIDQFKDKFVMTTVSSDGSHI